MSTNTERSRSKTIIWGCLFLCLLLAWCPDVVMSQEKQRQSGFTLWFNYEPQVVTLRGVVVQVDTFGPPNYGETPEEDIRVTYYSLELGNPISVRGDSTSDVNTDTIEGVDRLQLVTEDQASLRGLRNKKVVVKGSLFRALLGVHYTPVLLRVIKITAR